MAQREARQSPLYFDVTTSWSKDLSPDASYRSSVFREPFLGSVAIRQYWQRGASTQREVAVHMGPPIITDGRAAVEWWTTTIDPMTARSPCRVACSRSAGLNTALWYRR
jgi:hypothetical protein